MTTTLKKKSEEHEIDLHELSLYEPLKIQSSELATPLLFYFVFGVVQGIRSHGFGWGVLARWLGGPQNDYGLIVACSITGLAAIAATVLAIHLHRADGSPFLLGVFGIVPAVTNLVLMLFLFYLIGFRGLWSLTEFASHFTFLPIIKVIFFSLWGSRGCRAFYHLYQMRRLVEARRGSELVSYISTYRLSHFR